MNTQITDTQMECLVREALKRYGDFKAVAALRKMEKKGFTPEQLEQIILADTRVCTIQSWLDMLTYDERFVVQAHLIDKLEWDRVTHQYMKHWDELFTRSDRQLGTYQAQALQKILSFCEAFPDIVLELFGEFTENSIVPDGTSGQPAQNKPQPKKARG